MLILSINYEFAFPPPADCPALQGFLRIVNFYRKFICGAALLLRPMTDALKGDPKDFSWTPEMNFAESTLASVPSLVHPDPSTKISL